MSKINQNIKFIFALVIIITATLIFFVVLIALPKSKEQKVVIVDPSLVATDLNIPQLPTPSEYSKNYPPLDITIEQVATFSDRYFVKGTLHQNDTTYGNIESVDISSMILSDSEGKEISVGPIDFGSPPQSLGLVFSFYTYSKGNPGPLKITIPSARFNIPVTSPVFEINFGDHPQDNQEWKAIGDFNLAGHHVHISDVTTRLSNNGPQIEFTLTGSDVVSAIITDKSVQTGGSGNLEIISQDQKLLIVLKYPGGLPTGKHEFTIENISFFAQGYWQTTFLPESIDKSPSQFASDMQNACFLNNDWVKNKNEMLSNSSASGLTGRLLVENSFLENSSEPLMAIIDWNSSDKKNVLPLSPAALSPDGSMMVSYDWQTQKIRLHNFQNGQDTYIKWAIAPERSISWSRNGESLAYDRDDGLYINKIDGTNSKNIPGMGEGIYLGSWMPDAKNILVTRFLAKEGKPLIQIVDINTGATKNLFSISNISPVPELSPDGKKILFTDLITGTQSIGVFTSDFEGTGRHLLASFQYMSVFSYAWSPDSQWVILSVTDQVNSRGNVTNLLINPITCEVNRLPFVDWVVRFWSPKP